MKNETIKKGQIFFPYKGIVFNVSEIIERFDGQSYSFSFKPDYKIISLIPDGAPFEGIQGLDLDLKKEFYERKDIPVFVSERISVRITVFCRFPVIKLQVGGSVSLTGDGAR